MAASAVGGDRVIRLLFVEDDEDDVVLARDLLAAIGHTRYELDWEPDVEAALEAMCRERHDAYLVDFHLGTATGIEVLAEARARGCTGPIILLTGRGDIETDRRAMASGAVDYLAKDAITPALLERSLRYAIEQKRIEAELAEMRRRVADSGEAERLRLARELHDGPLQDVIGARIQLGRVASLATDRSLRGRLGAVEENLLEAIDRLRNICGALRPPALAPFGLEVAIRAHAERFQEAHPELRLDLNLDADGSALPEATRMAMFRIYQQALANVVRHSGASHVAVRFRLGSDDVRLEVADDGSGFEVPRRWIDLAQRGRYGLLGAAERAESIGGRLEVASSPADGTRLRAVAPLRPSAGDGAPSAPSEGGPDG